MKAATVRELRQELNGRDPRELVDICLRLSRFKKENKELLTYLLYEAADEFGYIESVKSEIEVQFSEINFSSYYFMKKSLRKILRNIKKYIRYSQKKQTEVELLMHFCNQLKEMTPTFRRSTILVNLYERQLKLIENAIAKLHEDLQFDYQQELAELKG